MRMQKSWMPPRRACCADGRAGLTTKTTRKTTQTHPQQRPRHGRVLDLSSSPVPSPTGRVFLAVHEAQVRRPQSLHLHGSYEGPGTCLAEARGSVADLTPHRATSNIELARGKERRRPRLCEDPSPV